MICPVCGWQLRLRCQVFGNNVWECRRDQRFWYLAPTS